MPVLDLLCNASECLLNISNDSCCQALAVPFLLRPCVFYPDSILCPQVVAGAGAVAAGIWVVHHFLMPPALRWWRGSSGPSADEKAAAAIAAAIQAQVRCTAP